MSLSAFFVDYFMCFCWFCAFSYLREFLICIAAVAAYLMLRFCKIAVRPTNSMEYFPHRSPFGSRSLLDCFSIGSRSVLDRSSIVSRSSFVHPPFILRSAIEDRSKNDRRNIGESSEARRRCIETLMGNQGKGDSNKNFFWPHYFLYAQYTTLAQANSRLHDAIDPT